MFRADVFANPGLHPQAAHQVAHERQKGPIDGRRVAERKTARYTDGRVSQLHFKDVLAIIPEVVNGSGYQAALRIKSDVRQDADCLISFRELDPSVKEFDPK
jgi:hypothetical protein